MKNRDMTWVYKKHMKDTRKQKNKIKEETKRKALN